MWLLPCGSHSTEWGGRRATPDWIQSRINWACQHRTSQSAALKGEWDRFFWETTNCVLFSPLASLWPWIVHLERLGGKKSRRTICCNVSFLLKILCPPRLTKISKECNWNAVQIKWSQQMFYRTYNDDSSPLDKRRAFTQREWSEDSEDGRNTTTTQSLKASPRN